MAIDGMTIFYIILGFFGLVFLSAGITMFVVWRRRKLSFCNFLSKTGKWERESWPQGKLHETFSYNNQIYKYDIKKCTRDFLNRPIAHYYKGNPEQMDFDLSQTSKKVKIGTEELTTEDFQTLMETKVLRDLFQDEEVIRMLWIILIAFGIGFIILLLVVATHNPLVGLKNDNNTIIYFTRVCADACKQTLITPPIPLNTAQPIPVSGANGVIIR